ncbi:MAG: type II secretion system protein [Acetatifactor sp.]
MDKANNRNNKGFSLVELIIVIAILAVLSSVLTLNFVRYYNNACVNTDIANAREIANKLGVAIAGEDGASVPANIQGVGGTTVTDVEGLTVLPYSKKDRNAEWVITTSFEDGVVEISLGGYLIFPDGSGGNAYYNAFCAH